MINATNMFFIPDVLASPQTPLRYNDFGAKLSLIFGYAKLKHKPIVR